jgi:ABC-2 type transport system ATP-binding protein
MVCELKGIQNANLREFAQQLLRMVNLESDIDNKVINLSGGMARRVSIALSTIGNPKIIIFDEPTTGLDPETR